MTRQASLIDAPVLVFDTGQDGLLVDLHLAFSERVLIYGTSGAGKTRMMRYWLERLCAKTVQLIFDWKGEFRTLQEVHPYVLVGDVDAGADRPIRADLARRQCRQLLTAGISVIIDLSAIADEEEKYEVVALWADEVMRLPLDLPWIVQVAFPEAHELAPWPARGEVKCSVQVRRIWSQGRFRGVVPIADTQRFAETHPRLRDSGNLLIGRTQAGPDLTEALKRLGFPAGRNGELQTLPTGTFFAKGRAFGDGGIRLVRTGEVRSRHFDALLERALRVPTPTEIAAALNAMRQADEAPIEDTSRQELLEHVARLEAQIKRLQEGDPDDARIQRAVTAATAPKDAEIQALRVTVEAMRAHARLILTTSGELPDAPTSAAEAQKPEEIDPVRAQPSAEQPPEILHVAERLLSLLEDVKGGKLPKREVVKRLGTTERSTRFTRALGYLRRIGAVRMDGDKVVKV